MLPSIRHSSLSSSFSSLLVLLLLLPWGTAASVLAIDYGTDFTKLSLMKPGVPFDVILNRDSKRKISSSVAWKGEERLFGADAVNIAARYPATSFSGLKLLQGTLHSSPQSQYHHTLYPALEVSEIPERGTHQFTRKEGETWSNEELVAMQFAYAKELAEGVAGERVRDAIVTVPAYYTQPERQAVLDSLHLAGLKPLSLINDGTAIAVNFAMSRTFPTPEYHIIYDAGSSGIRATLVSFETKTEPVSPKSKKTKDITHISVKGYGYDKLASGLEMDLRIRELLRGKFEAAHLQGKSLEKEHRAIAKLWKEASRVKTILSANSDSRVSIESFHNDIDFKTSISRDEFEDACRTLRPSFTAPIWDALASVNLEPSDITSIILAGGISRVPMVQTALKLSFGEAKIAQNVNADEAAVLGAAFYGASLSPQFKTKEIKVEDRLLGGEEFVITYTAEKKEGKEERVINTVIFPSGAKYGSKKVLNFKRKDDFVLNLSYRYPDDLESSFLVHSTSFEGVREGMKNLTEKGAVDPVVRVQVALTESGLAVVHDSFVYGEVKEETIAGKIKNLFGGSSSSSSTSTDEATESLSSTASAEASEETETKKETKMTPHVIGLEMDNKYVNIVPYMAEEMSEARKRLVAVDQAEHKRAKTAEARNMLEGYLYRLRDLLDGDEKTPFIRFSKEEERKKLEEKFKATMTWFDGASENAEAIELWRRRDEMEAIEKPIQFRYEENEAAPKELENIQQAIVAGRAFLQSAHQNRTMEEEEGLEHKYTLEELEKITERVKETEEWLKQGVEEQKKLKANDDPVLVSVEMKARGVTLQKEVMRLLKRRTPTKKVKKDDKKKEEKEKETEKEAKSETKAEEENRHVEL